MIHAVQGTRVDTISVALGDGEDPVSISSSDVDAYFRVVRDRFVKAVTQPSETYPLPTAHCAVCRWTARCHDRWRVDDHLTRVAFLTVDQALKLERSGVATLTALANSPSDLTVPGINDVTLRRLQEQIGRAHV